jgi:hypothetical protein
MGVFFFIKDVSFCVGVARKMWQHAACLWFVMLCAGNTKAEKHCYSSAHCMLMLKKIDVYQSCALAYSLVAVFLSSVCRLKHGKM